MVQVGSQIYKGCSIFFAFKFSLLPLLAKSSYGWLQLRDHLVSLPILQIYHPNNTHWFLGFCNFGASWPLFFFSFRVWMNCWFITYYCSLRHWLSSVNWLPNYLFPSKALFFYFSKFNFQWQKLFPYVKSKIFKITLVKSYSIKGFPTIPKSMPKIPYRF